MCNKERVCAWLVYMPNCPNCNSANTYGYDRKWKKLIRKLAGNNRYYCKACHATWKKKEPFRLQKLTVISTEKSPGAQKIRV